MEVQVRHAIWNVLSMRSHEKGIVAVEIYGRNENRADVRQTDCRIDTVVGI